MLFTIEFLYLVANGMDQNTSMISKLCQSVESIVDQFMKTQLCGILVHEVGFYTDAWIDVQNIYGNNQVVTSIMHILKDVMNWWGNKLPSILCIEENSCARKINNQCVCFMKDTCEVEVLCRSASKLSHCWTYTQRYWPNLHGHIGDFETLEHWHFEGVTRTREEWKFTHKGICNIIGFGAYLGLDVFITPHF